MRLSPPDRAVARQSRPTMSDPSVWKSWRCLVRYRRTLGPVRTTPLVSHVAEQGRVGVLPDGAAELETEPDVGQLGLLGRQLVDRKAPEEHEPPPFDQVRHPGVHPRAEFGQIELTALDGGRRPAGRRGPPCGCHDRCPLCLGELLRPLGRVRHVACPPDRGRVDWQAGYRNHC